MSLGCLAPTTDLKSMRVHVGEDLPRSMWLCWILKLFIYTILVDGNSPSIASRSRRFVGISTGLRLVDVMFPIAQGQRELIIGDRQTGKTQVVMASSFSQAYRNSQVCSRKRILSYISSLGQRISSSVRCFSTAFYNDVDIYTVSLLASITSTMSAQFIGPLSATAIAELSRNSGEHCHVSYDDLSKHAVAYRQLCLYLRKPAGREAFPSDVFYLHARILERSCCLAPTMSLGTLLSLPVIETLSNDLSAYIATNVISITDGQLYLDVTLFGIGCCPAISLEKSVSRVGAKSLDPLFRSLSFRIYSLIGDYKQEAGVALKSEAFRVREHRYSHLIRLYIQRSSIDRWSNTIYIWCLITGWLDAVHPSILHAIQLQARACPAPSSSWLGSPTLHPASALASATAAIPRVVAEGLARLAALLTRLSVLVALLSPLSRTSISDFASSVAWLTSYCSPPRTCLAHRRKIGSGKENYRF
jgi:F0F1-type ATP synthase alpha subunit